MQKIIAKRSSRNSWLNRQSYTLKQWSKSSNTGSCKSGRKLDRVGSSRSRFGGRCGSDSSGGAGDHGIRPGDSGDSAVRGSDDGRGTDGDDRGGTARRLRVARLGEHAPVLLKSRLETLVTNSVSRATCRNLPQKRTRSRHIIVALIPHFIARLATPTESLAFPHQVSFRTGGHSLFFCRVVGLPADSVEEGGVHGWRVVFMAEGVGTDVEGEGSGHTPALKVNSVSFHKNDKVLFPAINSHPDHHHHNQAIQTTSDTLHHKPNKAHPRSTFQSIFHTSKSPQREPTTGPPSRFQTKQG